MKTQERGQLTERIKAKSKELFGHEINVKELRLMPYILYVMTNEQVIDPGRISREERKILSKWRKSKYIEGGASGLRITKEFWNMMNEIVYLGYVDATH